MAHERSPRKEEHLLTIACGAIPPDLIESELLGHVKGAFTGAIRDKQGRFAAADGGTILLDEIGDISPLIQLKLLRVLQEKEFEMERTLGFTAVKHQSFVGAGYFDEVQMTVTGGLASTVALHGSTEEAQFEPVLA